MVLALLFAALFALVGLLGVVGVLQPLSLLQTIVSTGVSNSDTLGSRGVDSDAVESGRVGIVGTVESSDSLVQAPISGRECVGYVVDQEIKHRTVYTGFGLLVPRWHRKDVRYEFPAIRLADDSGRVRVEFDGDGDSWQTQAPDGLFSNVQLGTDERVRCDGDEPTPDAVRSALNDVSEPSNFGVPHVDSTHSHRYTEWRLEPGDRLYVLGNGVDEASEPTIQTSIDDDVLLDLEANSYLRLVGLLVIRLLAAMALALFGFGMMVLFV